MVTTGCPGCTANSRKAAQQNHPLSCHPHSLVKLDFAACQRDTLNGIREHLKAWDYTTCQIHGGMGPRERKQAQEEFRTGVQVCVATEAAGEGINLQFCHLMINYDLPWNPTRLEQRLGRIHRIGQTRDVYAFNFVATDSEDGQPIIEGRILHRLLEKLDQMRDALEGRVFDVIGEVLSLNDVNLPEMLRDVAYDPRRLEEYIDQIDRINPEKLREYEEATGIALARANVDFSGFQTRNLDIEERRLMPRYVEAHFLSAAREVGLRLEPRADGLWRVEHVLADLRSDRLLSVRRVGRAEAGYRKVTFHKDHLEQNAHVDAELVGPGHPLYAAVDEKLNDRLAPLIGRAAAYVDPQSSVPYRLHFFEIAVKGKNTRGEDQILFGELVGVREEAGQFEIVPSDLLLNFPPHPAPGAVGTVDPQAASDFLKRSYQRECRDRTQAERNHYASVCRDYLVKSFEARITRAQERAMSIGAMTARNPDYKLAFDEAFKVVADLKRDKDDRLAGLERLALARPGPVRYIGTAIVLTPDATVEAQLGAIALETDSELRRKKEKKAEDLTIASLIAEGFPAQNIERIGNERRGFDIRAHRVIDHATGVIEVRRIEVKGYTSGGAIQMTLNEWCKAQQLGETYWLYVVWDPLTPEAAPVRIQNPAAKLDHAKREILASRFFLVPAEAINQHGKLL